MCGGIATIYRLGDLTGRYSDGVFQENINQNAIYLRLKSILEIGHVSNTILRNSLEFSPVDYVSKAVKSIIWSQNCKNRIFNIYNPNMVSTENLLNFIAQEEDRSYIPIIYNCIIILSVILIIEIIVLIIKKIKRKDVKEN